MLCAVIGCHNIWYYTIRVYCSTCFISRIDSLAALAQTTADVSMDGYYVYRLEAWLLTELLVNNP